MAKHIQMLRIFFCFIFSWAFSHSLCLSLNIFQMLISVALCCAKTRCQISIRSMANVSILFSGRLASICLFRMWLCHFNVTRPLDSWHTFLGLSAVRPHYSAVGFICLTLNITMVQQGAVICCMYQVAVSAHLNYTTWLYANQWYPIGAGFYHCITW